VATEPLQKGHKCEIPPAWHRQGLLLKKASPTVSMQSLSPGYCHIIISVAKGILFSNSPCLGAQQLAGDTEFLTLPSCTATAVGSQTMT